MGATASGERLRAGYEIPSWQYRLIRTTTAGIMRLLYRWKVTHIGAVPADGPVIVVVNHLHLLDPFAVAPRTDRQIVTMVAGKWRENWLMRTFLDSIGVIYVRRGEVDRQALRDSQQLLNKGKVLAIAPEGTRSRVGSLQEAKAGTSYLVMRTGATVVPIVCWGIERLKEWRPWKRPLVNVVVGKPFRLPQPEGRLRSEQLGQLTELLMIQIGRLIPESYRGVYAERIAAYEAGDRPELDVIYV